LLSLLYKKFLQTNNENISTPKEKQAKISQQRSSTSGNIELSQFLAVAVENTK
jgi:hypothetical protein